MPTFNLRFAVAMMMCGFIAVCSGRSGEVTAGEPPAKEQAAVTASLNAFWAEVSRSVAEGDFQGYAATCHPQGVLVSGVKKNSQPLADALVRWKPGFTATKAGKMKASVAFRFSSRLNGGATAHETGIFRYASSKPNDTAGVKPDADSSVEYIHFEALLVQKNAKWLVLMEYQKAKATAAEWQKLRPATGG